MTSNTQVRDKSSSQSWWGDLIFTAAPFRTLNYSSDTTVPSVRELLGLPKAKPSQAISQNPSQDSAELPPPTNTTARTVSDGQESASATPEGSDDDKPHPSNLARFAYVAPPRSSSFQSLHTICSARSVEPNNSSEVPPPKPRKFPKATSHRFTQFSDADLARLLKCVSCDLTWTARKTVVQKMKHVQTCAKKTRLTDDTIAILIRSELEKTPRVASHNSKGKEKATEPEQVEPQTLLEQAINDGGARKRTKRPQVVETVKDPAQTRQNILDRARLLLSSQFRTHKATVTVDSNPQMRGLPDALYQSPPRTQPFGQSALAQKFRSSALADPTPTPIYVPSPAPIASSSRAEPEVHPVLANPSNPPRTQPFGESVLAKGLQPHTHKQPPPSPRHDNPVFDNMFLELDENEDIPAADPCLQTRDDLNSVSPLHSYSGQIILIEAVVQPSYALQLKRTWSMASLDAQQPLGPPQWSPSLG